MKLPVSKPLFAGLLLASVLSVIALLRPEGAPVPDDLLAAPRAPATGAGEAGRRARAAAPSFARTLLAPPSDLARRPGFGQLPPPPPVAAPAVPVPPPRPVAPAPAFTYLGRLERDGHLYVFLGRGDDVEVVEQGSAVDAAWRVERVLDTAVELRYLPLNETRQLAMSHN